MISYNDIKNNLLEQGFEAVALDIFRFQASNLEVYRNYLNLLGVNPENVTSVEQIPFLPIELFRSHRVYCGEGEPELTFASSGTTGGETSRHYVASSALYRDSYLGGFREFYGAESDYKLVTMLPSYREGSSLLYMIRDLQERCNGSKVLLWGVTFALLEEARSGRDVRLPEGSIVLETGGMKGRGKAIEREELHRILCDSFGVESIASEYGMCELLSQGYSRGEGIFYPSSTMRVVGRKVDNPLQRTECEEVCG